MRAERWLLLLVSALVVSISGCGPASSDGGDPCASDPCAATGKTCSAKDGVAVCACPANFADQGNGCVRLGACAVNPCTGANKTACYEANSGATCVCDPGFEDNGAGGCTPIPTGSACPAHALSGDDALEPDDCATRSPLYADGVARSLTAGDVDWTHFSVGANHIVKLSISGASYPVTLDVFGADGTTAVAADHSGSTNPSVSFVAPGGLLYARVKASVASDGGGYTLTLGDLGADDFPNSSAAAGVVVGSTFAGSLQFTDDEDFARLSVQAGHSYRFTLASSTAAGVAVEIKNLDGVTLRKTLDMTIAANGSHVARAPFDGTYLLRARALSPGATGAFSVAMQDLGADDRGDMLLDADVISPATSASGGTFERTDDEDTFKFNAITGHLYRFTCTKGSYGCVMAMRDPAGVVVAQQSSTYSSTTIITATAATPGNWSITVASGTSSSTGSYSYLLEDLGGDDYPNSYQTPYAITLGGNVNGSIELANDHDVFGVSTTAGHYYRVTCASPTYSSCPLTVRDPGGATIATTSANRDVLFRSPAGGQYTIDMTNTAAGQYTLTVTDGGPDDAANDTSAQAVTLVAGTPASGAISYQGDVDYFSFPTVAGHVYQVSCTPAGSGCQLNAYDPANTAVAQSTTAQQLVGVLSSSGGTYTVKVTGYTATWTGAYTVTLTDVGTDDFPSTTTGAPSLTLGTGVTGNLQYYNDTDVFTFSGTAPRVYNVTCAQSASTSSGIYLCSVVVKDATGTVVASSQSYAATAVAAFKAKANQTYSVYMSSLSGAYYGGYQVTVTDQGTDDYGDTVATATATTPGTPLDGRSDFAGDKDVVTFPTVANHIYKATCNSSSYALCGLTVRDASGTTIASDYTSTSAVAEFYTATAQTFSLEVSSAASSEPGAYSFQVVDMGPDDYGNTVAAASLINPGTISGSLQYNGDVDVFTFNVTAGKIYSFDVSDFSSIQVTVRNPNGTELLSKQRSDVSFKATTSGTYSFELLYYGGIFGGSTGKGGPYSFTYAEATDDAPDSSTGAPALTLGSTRNAVFEYTGDQDWYAVTLTSAVAYNITTTGAVAYVSVFAADGTTQVVSLSYRNATYTPTTSGTYYVKVQPASSTGAYTVRVQ